MRGEIRGGCLSLGGEHRQGSFSGFVGTDYRSGFVLQLFVCGRLSSCVVVVCLSVLHAGAGPTSKCGGGDLTPHVYQLSRGEIYHSIRLSVPAVIENFQHGMSHQDFVVWTDVIY